jgi:hypothetical protein
MPTRRRLEEIAREILMEDSTSWLVLKEGGISDIGEG